MRPKVSESTAFAISHCRIIPHLQSGCRMRQRPARGLEPCPCSVGSPRLLCHSLGAHFRKSLRCVPIPINISALSFKSKCILLHSHSTVMEIRKWNIDYYNNTKNESTACFQIHLLPQKCHLQLLFPNLGYKPGSHNAFSS